MYQMRVDAHPDSKYVEAAANIINKESEIIALIVVTNAGIVGAVLAREMASWYL